MKTVSRFLFRLARAVVFLAGISALLLAAAQFTNLPWRAYRSLFAIAAPFPGPPTHILVMGGSGIPGETGLMRTFYGAQAAQRHPDAELLVAMPLGASESEASRAYLGELRLRGVDPARIHILDRGRNTREQALRLAEYLTRWTNGFPRVLIVTSPEHVRRTAACIRKVCRAQLAALPAHPLSIEDPLPWRAGDLDSPGFAAPAAIPDIGSSLQLRYNLWANLRYTQESLREFSALFYYHLRGWI